MSKDTEGRDYGPTGGRRTPSPIELAYVEDNDAEAGPTASSSRNMPVPEYMQRRADRQQGAGPDDDEGLPTYEEAIHMAAECGATGEPEGGQAEAGDSELSPEEIAIVLKMQSDRDQYIPDRRDSYSEAIEMDSDYEEAIPMSYESAPHETSYSAATLDYPSHSHMTRAPHPVSLSVDTGPTSHIPSTHLAMLNIGPEENGDVPESSQWEDPDIAREEFRPPRAEPEADSLRGSRLSIHVDHMERGRASERRSDFECTSCWVLNEPITWLVRYLQAQSQTRLILIGLLVLAAIGAVLFLSLFPASFVYIEYHQVALPKSKMYGTVDRETVYYPGCYVLGPDTTLVRFDASAHTITETVGVFTLDTIAITMRYSLVYFLRQKEVGMLYTKFMHDYEEPFRLMVGSVISNKAATSFTVDQFRFNRTFVERELHAAVRKKLGGNCCPECCPKGCQSNVYCDTCQQDGSTCDRAYHVDARIFNLLSISIPNEVFERYLRFTILEIEKEKEYFLQDNAVIKKETQMLTSRYHNSAKEITSNGTFEAIKVTRVAQADMEKTVQSSYIKALKSFFTTLRVTNPEHKSSLMMIRAIEDNLGNIYAGHGYNESILFAH